jgi:predicted nucleotidyltransferase
MRLVRLALLACLVTALASCVGPTRTADAMHTQVARSAGAAGSDLETIRLVTQAQLDGKSWWSRLASQPILMLADLRHAFLKELRESAGRLVPAPVNVTLFGSFARGDDDARSDVDMVLVRPSTVDEDDWTWADSIARWETYVRRISGNAPNIIEVGEREVLKLIKSRQPLWQAIGRQGIALQGRPLADIGSAALA